LADQLRRQASPWHYRALARSAPPIDDITMDTENPPAFGFELGKGLGHAGKAKLAQLAEHWIGKQLPSPQW